MIATLRRLFSCTTGAAAVEAAIFSPIFLLMMLGITDLGSGMFVGTTVNAAAQSGAAYAVINFSSGCASMSAACLTGIQTAMNDATGNPSFCTASAQNPTPCTASFTACPDPNGGICFIVTANFWFSSFLPNATYAWMQPMTVSSTATIRIQ
jgi:Flp pilus assembly protein TadG